MTDIVLSKLESVDPRKVWSDEAGDFTPWLSKNMEILGEALGIQLEFDALEYYVGNYKLDIAAKVSGQQTRVIIENQLGAADDNHLGRLMVYAGGLDAGIVIWITTGFKDEHLKALDWLNNVTLDEVQFYGVTINVRQIEASPYAPEFRAVAFPTSPPPEKTPSKPAPSPLQERYRAFFQDLIDVLRTEWQFTQARRAQALNYYGFSSGYSRILYIASFASDGTVRAELTLERDKEFNEALFDSLHKRRDEVEKILGSLDWNRNDEASRCRIGSGVPGTVNDSEDELQGHKAWLIDRLLLLHSVFDPLLSELPGQIVSD